MATKNSSPSGKSFKVDLVLHDKRPDEDAPDIALYQLNRRGKVEKKLAVAQEGKVTLEEAWREKAQLEEETAALKRELAEMKQKEADRLGDALKANHDILEGK